MLKRLFPDLVGYRPKYLANDTVAALSVTFLSVPQCIAYAMIAGLPPATGLYAAAVPSILVLSHHLYICLLLRRLRE